ncbi:hypothetical protein HH310_40845 [Actinoplanes sp. TBRC 11911]|uniref:hypothetical protein n=1 Tax=Actinoplanes sp. TBRC 11911 TaxID=2729386 RepID=UPI00145DFDD9|nr:hypothetical protein [Actinoplanes sp. TBRC 11911]NMO57506.1 hypothetical protein [Actinoplanes sp. TBRC 11911]
MTIDAETQELLDYCAAQAPAYTSTQFDTLQRLLAPLHEEFQAPTDSVAVDAGRSHGKQSDAERKNAHAARRHSARPEHSKTSVSVLDLESIT